MTIAMMKMILTVRIILTDKHDQKFHTWPTLVQPLLKIKHSNRCMKMNFPKNKNRYGICRMRIYIVKKYGSLRKIDYNNSIRLN